MTAVHAAAIAEIPPSHADLLSGAIVGVLTTLGVDGQPHSSPVWVARDGPTITVNTTLERQKGRDLLANSKASLIVVDPENTSRFIQIRGDVDLSREGAEQHLDALTRRYTDHPRFYGCVYPIEQRALETRVIGRIWPRRITLDAIHH